MKKTFIEQYGSQDGYQKQYAGPLGPNIPDGFYYEVKSHSNEIIYVPADLSDDGNPITYYIKGSLIRLICHYPE